MDFVVPKSGHRCEKQPVCVREDLGIPFKDKMKNTPPKKIYEIQPPDLLFLAVLYGFYISQYHFP